MFYTTKLTRYTIATKIILLLSKSDKNEIVVAHQTSKEGLPPIISTQGASS